MASQADLQTLVQQLGQSGVPSGVNNGNPNTVYNMANSSPATPVGPGTPWDFSMSNPWDIRPNWNGQLNLAPVIPPPAPPTPVPPGPVTGGPLPPNPIITPWTPPLNPPGRGGEGGGGGGNRPGGGVGGGGALGGGGAGGGGAGGAGGAGGGGGGMPGLGGTWLGGKLGVGPDGTFDWQQAIDMGLDVLGIEGDWWSSNINQWNQSEIMQGVLNTLFPGLGSMAQKFALSPLAHRLGLVPEWLKDMVLDGKITQSEDKQRREMMKQWESDLNSYLKNMGDDASKSLIDLISRVNPDQGPQRNPTVEVGGPETVTVGEYAGNNNGGAFTSGGNNWGGAGGGFGGGGGGFGGLGGGMSGGFGSGGFGGSGSLAGGGIFGGSSGNFGSGSGGGGGSGVFTNWENLDFDSK